MSNFYKDAVKKIKNKSGETLVEVLVTILLVGIVSAGFLVVVQTAQTMSTHVFEIDETFYEESSKAERVAADDDDTDKDKQKFTDGTVKLEFTKSNNPALTTTSIEIPVKAFNGEYGMHSYRLKND